jgi:hypothetical protein
MGREKGMGRGRSVCKQPGTRVDEVAPHRQEGFQVSKRDSGPRGAIKGSHQGELSKGVTKGLCHVLSIIDLYIRIMLLCECG